jgi:hypothetical protein
MQLFLYCLPIGRLDFLTQRLCEWAAEVTIPTSALKNQTTTMGTTTTVDNTQSHKDQLLEGFRKALSESPPEWLTRIAKYTEGFTGADLSLLCKRAHMAHVQHNTCAHMAPLQQMNPPSFSSIFTIPELKESLYSGSYENDEEENSEDEAETESCIQRFLNSANPRSPDYQPYVAATGSREKGEEGLKRDVTETKQREIETFDFRFFDRIPSEGNFNFALQTTKPSVAQWEVEEYMKWDKYERR